MSREHTFTDSDRAMLSARVDQFHVDLGNGSVVEDWEPYLLRLPKLLRKRVLIELAVVELAHEWRAGRRPQVEQYLDRFPELGPDVPEPLVLEEYRCRLMAKLPADTSAFAGRFPSLFPAAMDKLRALEHEVRQAPPSDADRGAQPLRGYTKVTWIGGGAFADVWLARNANGQEKALKIIRERMSSDAAQRELKALEQVKNVRHKCVLVTEDYWVENGQLHIVSQLAEGSLKGRMEQCIHEEGLPGIPVAELFAYLCDAASGLDYLHELNITHRDVKPDNILLVSGGAVLADFGLARKQVHLITQQSVFAGTMPYMAPELFGGEGGPPSDQYALALTYMHLRQGRHPLKLLPYPQIMTQHLCGEYDLDDFVTEAERAVLLTALDQVPTSRFPSCLDFARALAEALGLPFQDRRKRMSGSQPTPNPRPRRPEPVVELESITVAPKLETEVGVKKPLAHTKTAVRSGTVTNPARPPSVATRPAKPPTPPSKLVPLVVVGVLILALAGMIALVLFGRGNDPDTPPTEPTPDTRTNPNPVGPGPTPPKLEVAPEPRPWLPDATPKPRYPLGTTPVSEGAENISTDGKYYLWVTVDGNGPPTRFRFIPAGGTPGGKVIGPLYLMEEKVSNAHVAGKPYANPNEPTTPAVGMDRGEAQATAARIVSGGRLPTPEEWDLAAGYYLPSRPRPAELSKAGVPLVNVAAPGPSRKGIEGADLSHFGLLDMAGNGCEWTSADLPGDPTRAITRGRNFLFAGPLTFALLETEQKEPKAAFANKGNKYTGFRIAISAPPPSGK